MVCCSSNSLHGFNFMVIMDFMALHGSSWLFMALQQHVSCVMSHGFASWLFMAPQQHVSCVMSHGFVSWLFMALQQHVSCFMSHGFRLMALQQHVSCFMSHGSSWLFSSMSHVSWLCLLMPHYTQPHGELHHNFSLQY